MSKNKILAALIASTTLIFMSINICAKSEERIFTMSLLPAQFELHPLYTYSSLEAQLYSALYEGLVSYDPFSLKPVPAMAEKWEILDDGTRYRFHINPEVTYWNGEAVTSSHFRDAWLTMLQLGNESPFAFLLDPIVNASEYRRGEIEDPSKVGIKVISDLVLDIILKEPANHFLSILAHQSLVAIHPGGLANRNWNEYDSPPGSGPYYIVEKSETKLVMARNELYWDRQHSEYDKIIIEFNENPEESAARFNTGEIQWLYNGFIFKDIKIPDAIQITPQFSTSYYFFSAHNPPYDDGRIRRALFLLLPLEDIRSTEMHFVPSGNLVPKIPGYPDVNGITSGNKDLAMQLLEESGYPNGRGLPEIHLVFSDNPESRRVADIMANTWKEMLDISVRSDFVDFAQQQRAMKSGDFTIATLSWIGDYADPMSFLQLWISDSTVNDAGYSDDRFDSLVQAGNSLQGIARYEGLAEAEQYLLDSAIILPVSHSPALNVIDLELIGGWYPNPLDSHPFKYLYPLSLSAPRNIAENDLN